MCPRHPIPTSLLILAAFALFPIPAIAGWMTITNETKQAIVIQETGGPLNRPIRGKSVKLQPGETYREFHLLGGEKKVTISDADAPSVPLARDKLAWTKDDTSFAVKPDGGAVKVAPAEKPAETPITKK